MSVFEKLIRIVSTFFIVTVSWIFFRAESVGQAWQVIKIIFSGSVVNSSLTNTLFAYGIAPRYFIFLFLMLIALASFDYIQQKKLSIRYINNKPIVRWLFYFSIVYVIIFKGVWGNQQFIYFQF